MLHTLRLATGGGLVLRMVRIDSATKEGRRNNHRLWLGMIMAFMALHYTGGHAKVTDLSYGIATALWHTFGGLAVAIPSLIAFGFFRNKIDKITARAAMLSEELLETLRPAEGKASPAAAASAESRTPTARPVPRRAGADSTKEA